MTMPPTVEDNEPPHADSSPNDWQNDPFAHWVFIGVYRLVVLGAVILGVVCTFLAVALRLSLSNVPWAVPALNWAGGLLIAGGLIVYIGKQVRRLLLPIGAIALLASPYVVLLHISQTAAVAGSLMMGFVQLVVVGLGTIGFKQQRAQNQVAKRQRQRGRATMPAPPKAPAQAGDDDKPTAAALACGYTGAVFLTLAFLVDLLRP